MKLIMTEFVIISVPAERNPEKAYSEVSNGLAKFPVAQSVSKFPIPMNLKVCGVKLIYIYLGGNLGCPGRHV